MPPAAISHAMIAPKTPVAVAKGRGNDQMPAPTIEPTTIMVSANSENFCVCADATVVAAPGTSARACVLSIRTSSLGGHITSSGLHEPYIHVRKLRSALLHEPSAQPLIFLVGNCVRTLQPFELLELVGGAEPNHLPKLVASLLSPLLLPFSHPAVLRDQVYEYTQIREHNQHDHPDCLSPAGYVVTPEQVAKDRDQQPEPQHKDKYRKDVGQKVWEGETAWKQHASSPFAGSGSRHLPGTQPAVFTDTARAPASAACNASSLVSSNELRSTVPPAPRNAASTLSVVILRISKNRAALPDCNVLAACFMKSSLIPRSASRPPSAPEAAPTAAPASGIIKSRPISEPHSIPDTAPCATG